MEENLPGFYPPSWKDRSGGSTGDGLPAPPARAASGVLQD